MPAWELAWILEREYPRKAPVLRTRIRVCYGWQAGHGKGLAAYVLSVSLRGNNYE